jgi:hypothetical protein
MEEFRMVRAWSSAAVARSILPPMLLIPLWPAVLPDGALLAAAATAVFAVVRLARWQHTAVATVARLSPEGVEMEDWYGSRVRLTWQDIERIEVVASRVPSPRTITGAGRIRVRTGARQCVGLVGRGVYEIPRDAPKWLVAARERASVDPATGLRQVGIPLGVVDPLWERGPMGERVRRHRPDLFEAVVRACPGPRDRR